MHETKFKTHNRLFVELLPKWSERRRVKAVIVLQHQLLQSVAMGWQFVFIIAINKSHTQRRRPVVKYAFCVGALRQPHVRR